MPPLMSNHGNFIVSLGNVCRWLASKAEALGVEIYPGFAAAEVLYGEDGEVAGVATGDMGVGQGRRARRTASRAAWSCAASTRCSPKARAAACPSSCISRFELAEDREPQKFGIGLKELWQVAPEKHQPGLVQHTFGWPLDNRTGGGSFLYHLEDNLVVGRLRGAPQLPQPVSSRRSRSSSASSTHPLIAPTFEGGKRISYGARAITEGGWQSVPEAHLPGRRADRLRGRLHQRAAHQGQPQRDAVGHAGGRARRRGACATGRAGDELVGYENGWRASEIGRDLKKVRNVKPLWSKLGTHRSASRSAASTCGPTRSASRCSARCRHGKPDSATLEPAAKFKPIAYPKPDGVVTFDRLLIGVPVQHQSRGGPAGRT